MNEEKIQCPICLGYFHNITGKHLLKHGYKTVKDFLKDFPEAKTISSVVSRKLSKNYMLKVASKSKEIGKKSKATKLKKYGNGFGITGWNSGLTKETDERVKRNAESISTTWDKKSVDELIEYGKEVSSRLQGRNWEDLMGVELAQSRREYYKTFIGEKSNFYKDGRCTDYIDNYGPNWKSIRKYIYKRDEWTCQECGCKHKKLLCHHIINYLDFPLNERGEEVGCANNERNLITLCFSCHSKLCNAKVLRVNTVRYMDKIKSKYLVTTTDPKVTLDATYNTQQFA
jgi:hypothetical protein